ncbi:phosphoglycolate phosphatase [Tropicimonas marinistellae]|uniref:phosphoglycolate phosphatase n=1 Tax=Tropicimonas marinistellae TaxID=1739787 RepID=UPI0008304128|nr:phosphoglycolate phosphatase [Tropicimonas marinistellae]
MNIVFDLDGTLIDSAPDIQAVSAVILEGLGKEALTLDEVRSFVGEGAKVLVSRMMAARGIAETPDTHARIYGAFIAQYEFAVEKAVFYPGVVDMFAVLKASGHRLGLCTNKPELPARAVMRHMGMEPIFDAFLAGGMIDSRKPEPDMLLRVIEDLGGGPTLYVGDSEIDAETARRAEVPFALYSEGYRKAPLEEMPHDWAFDHFDRLPEIVREARARQTAAQ